MSKETNQPVITPFKYEPLDPNVKQKRAPIERRWIWLFVSILIAALVMAYIVIARSVSIQTNIDNPEIKIQGGLKFRLGDNYLITRGDHRISITADEYYPIDEALIVTAKRNQTIDYQLIRLPDIYRVSSLPEAGVQISINDKVAATVTPLSGLELSPGTHKITVTDPYYFPFEEALTVAGGGNNINHEISLKPAWANISIATEPTGANISIAEDSLGITPVASRVIQGQRNLRVKLDGYKSINKLINVVAGEDQDLGTLRLEKADGLVNVETVPSNANISVNGSYRGVSPIELKLEPESDYRIEAHKSGYQKQSKSVSVVSGKEQNLRISLVESKGTLSFNITPADAILKIDGKIVTDRQHNLSANPHKIEISKAGFETIEKTITPKTGFPQEVVIDLKTEAQALAAIETTAAINANGSRMLNVRGGTIVMGAQRRESGRRTNEVIKKTVLNKAFLISRTEITNAQYQKYAKGHNSGRVGTKSLNADGLPVVRVGWLDAAGYCNWLSKEEGLTPVYDLTSGALVGSDLSANGYRLPTEAEWAFSTRNKEGATLKFSWGNTYPPPANSGNLADSAAGSLVTDTISGYRDGSTATAQVASFKPNHRGIHDLSGNVSEWTHDFYSVAGYANEKSGINPSGPESGKSHVIRGSSWRHATLVELRASYRDNGNNGRDDLGFRIARNAK